MIASIVQNQVPIFNEYDSDDDDDEEMKMPPGADLPFEHIPFMSK